MYYISLDLEWNQAYAEQALAVQKRIECRLRGEVIQIGAVKLDEQLNICGSYSVIVRPRFFRRIHRHVMRLTGITQDMIDRGMPLPEAAESFRAWCGDDFAFLTWGPDDVPMLEDNFRAHKLDGAWLRRVYDLQPIYNSQTDGLAKQRSLEYVMEQFGIPQNLPAHDALNDAYFTALVAKRLDVIRGIKEYDSREEGFLESETLGDADAGDDGYVTIEELLSDDAVQAPLCPICREAMTQVGKPLHSKGQKYTYIFSCKQDGNMILTLKLHRNFNDTWRAKKTIREATDELMREHEEQIQRTNNRKRARRQRPRTKKKNAVPSTESE